MAEVPITPPGPDVPRPPSNPPATPKEAPQPSRHIPHYDTLINPSLGPAELTRALNPGYVDSGWSQMYAQIEENPFAFTPAGVARDYADVLRVKAAGEHAAGLDRLRVTAFKDFLGDTDYVIKAQQQAAAEPYALTAEDTAGITVLVTAATARMPELRVGLDSGRYTDALDMEHTLDTYLDGSKTMPQIGNNRKLLEAAPGGEEVIAAISVMQEAISRQITEASAVRAAKRTLDEAKEQAGG